MLLQFPSKIDPKKGYRYLNGQHFRSELDKCLQCPEKPCNQECPCKVDPSEFINAAMSGELSDMDYAALCIYAKQPLGSVCGVICPVNHCMSRCSRQKLDTSINIPALQAEIIRRACKEGRFRELIKKGKPTGKTVAIVGGGPAGLSAATCLASRGHKVIVFEKNSEVGGDVQLIPKYRFPSDVLDMDLELLRIVGDSEVRLNSSFDKSMEKDYDAVIYAIGSQNITKMSCPGANLAITPNEFFHLTENDIKDKSVVINGCGGVAVDVANVAAKAGAKFVTIFYRRSLDQAPLSPEERGAMTCLGVSVVPRVSVEKLEKDKNGKIVIHCSQLDSNLTPIKDSELIWKDVDIVVPALGQRSTIKEGTENNKIFVAGQARGKNTTAVQASASGKNAAMRCHAFLMGEPNPAIENDLISNFNAFEYEHRPCDISASLDGKKVVSSPFIAGASPFTENLTACKKYLDKGWGGLVIGVGSSTSGLRTYKKGKPHAFNPHLNASQALDIIKQLRKEYPKSILAAQIRADSDEFDEDFGKLSPHCDFVEIKCESADDYDVAKRFGKNSVIVLHGTSNHKSIAYGVKNKKEALKAFSTGHIFCVIEPYEIKRTGQGIEHLNTQVSFAMWRAGFKNTKEWVDANKEFDIEAIGEEPLVNHLVNPSSCIMCGKCTVCPTDAITIVPSRFVYKVDADKCTGCGLCETVCPTDAIALVSREKAKQMASKRH